MHTESWQLCFPCVCLTMLAVLKYLAQEQKVTTGSPLLRGGVYLPAPLQ